MTIAATVLMTAYNEERTIAGAIRSLLGQTRGDFELLVVDDGSTDRTGDLVRGLGDLARGSGDPRIRLLTLPRNLGRPAALNAGLAAARAPIIAVMDADDWSLPRRLEAEIGYLESHPDIDVVGSDYVVLDDIRGENYVRVTPKGHDDIVRSLGLFIPVAHGGVAYRREAVKRVGGYAELPGGIKDLEDLDLWIRLAAAGGRFASLPEVLHVYRISMATSKFHTIRSHAWRNRDHVSLNLRAIRTLNLPKRFYLPALARYVYPFLPAPVRRQLRRRPAGVRERPLTSEEWRAVEAVIAASEGGG